MISCDSKQCKEIQSVRSTAMGDNTQATCCMLRAKQSHFTTSHQAMMVTNKLCKLDHTHHIVIKLQMVLDDPAKVVALCDLCRRALVICRCRQRHVRRSEHGPRLRGGEVGFPQQLRRQSGEDQLCDVLS